MPRLDQPLAPPPFVLLQEDGPKLGQGFRADIIEGPEDAFVTVADRYRQRQRQEVGADLAEYDRAGLRLEPPAPPHRRRAARAMRSCGLRPVK